MKLSRQGTILKMLSIISRKQNNDNTSNGSVSTTCLFLLEVASEISELKRST